MSVKKIQFDGNTLIDLTQDTVVASKLHSGYTAHDANGDVITGSYTPPSSNFKEFSFSSPSAVAATNVTVVSGDSDVAAHYADTNAMVTIRKNTNNDTKGLAFLAVTNHQFPTAYGYYLNYNLSANNAGIIDVSLSSDSYVSSSNIYVKATSSGDIVVRCNNNQNSFGGADYIITFSW